MTTRFVDAAKAALIVAALLVAPTALAKPHDWARKDPPSRRSWVPEFDPAAGGAIIALLAGGALFIASRRKSDGR